MDVVSTVNDWISQWFFEYECGKIYWDLALTIKGLTFSIFHLTSLINISSYKIDLKHGRKEIGD